VRLETEVTLTAGENELTAYAFNGDNIKSADATVVVKGGESLMRKGTLYVVSIGVNRYANRRFDLRYAVPDARFFAAEVAKQQKRVGKFGRVEVVEILDGEATRANILVALEVLGGGRAPAGSPSSFQKIRKVEPEDAVVLYFAGHGTTEKDRFFMIPHDVGYAGALDALDEAGYRALIASCISDRDLEARFEPIDAGELLLVIDACNSGQALESEEKRRGPMNCRGLAQLAYEKGMNVLTAAQGYQAALEGAQLGHGFLTYALVEEGLKAGKADAMPKDGELRVREWLDYAVGRVPDMHEELLASAARGVKVTDAKADHEKVKKWSLQRPRVFYRREAEAEGMVVATFGR
ncbi:MAG: caspase family protein, partial [Planctomycetota bacterium]